MKQALEALKTALLIVFVLCVYSLALESINSYKSFKAECSTSPENKHDAIESLDSHVAKLMN